MACLSPDGVRWNHPEHADLRPDFAAEVAAYCARASSSSADSAAASADWVPDHERSRGTDGALAACETMAQSGPPRSLRRMYRRPSVLAFAGELLARVTANKVRVPPCKLCRCLPHVCDRLHDLHPP